MAAADTRAKRQATRDARVRRLRGRAAALEAEAARLGAPVTKDPAYWSQPLAPAGRGRARARLERADRASLTAQDLRREADALAATPVRVAGDAAVDAARRDAAAPDMRAGDLVQTTLFGARRVLRVNKRTVTVEGAIEPLRLEKRSIVRILEPAGQAGQ